MLTDENRRQLSALIATHVGFIPAEAAIEQLVGAELTRLAPPKNGPVLAGWLLDQALGRSDPAIFIRMVRTADAAGRVVEIHALIAQLEADPSLWRPGAVALWIPKSWPFLDREELRDVLSTMAIGTGPVAITIEAPDGFGKATMSAYIEDLARPDESLVVVPIELRKDAVGGVLNALVARLRIELGIDPADDTTHEEPERRAMVLARELAREAPLGSSTVWLVANVIDPPGLEPGVLRFIDVLLGEIQETDAALIRLRVILLASEVGILGLEQLPPVEHRFVLPEVAEPEVAAWLRAAVPGKPSGLYETAAKVVLADVLEQQPPPARWLEYLALQCRRTHRKLAGV
jgi:hypothetical protein